MQTESICFLVLLLLFTVTGCLGDSGLEGSDDGAVVEHPPESLTQNLTGDELRVRSDGNEMLIAYSIDNRDTIGETEAAVEVIAANDSTRHYCPGDSSGVLRVSILRGASERAGQYVTLWEDDRLLPTTPCRATDGGFGTDGSIETITWELGEGEDGDD